MQSGTVKFFNETKGFGFIVPSNGDSEIFVHSSGLIDRIRENEEKHTLMVCFSFLKTNNLIKNHLPDWPVHFALLFEELCEHKEDDF